MPQLAQQRCGAGARDIQRAAIDAAAVVQHHARKRPVARRQEQIAFEQMFAGPEFLSIGSIACPCNARSTMAVR